MKIFFRSFWINKLAVTESTALLVLGLFLVAFDHRVVVFGHLRKNKSRREEKI